MTPILLYYAYHGQDKLRLHKMPYIGRKNGKVNS